MPSQGPQLRANFSEGGWVFVVLSVFLFMTAKDFISPKIHRKAAETVTTSSSSQETNDVNQMPNNAKIIDSTAGSSIPVIKFLYCHSCGYAKAYQEYSSAIKEKYPDILVTGENYSPNIFRSLFANSLNFMRMAILGLIIFNRNPFVYFGMATPNVWNWLVAHKISGCLMIFFMTNAIEAQLLTSGAFEIYFNDIKIWSKLDTGRIPSRGELFTMIDSHLPAIVEPTILPDLVF